MARTLTQIRKENKMLEKNQKKAEEFKKAKQENFRLKNRRSIAFFGGVTKVAGLGVRFAGKKVASAIKPPTVAEKKRFWAAQKRRR